MPNLSLRFLHCIALAALCTGSIPVFASAQRTFVASYGNDTNACTVILPCRGFAAAVAQTNPGGEVIVLDSAGYGPVAITQSVSITSPRGVYAGITVFNTGNLTGVEISGAGINVVLRGLSIIGQGGETGVQFDQGTRLTIEDCEIANVANGIDAAAASSVVTVRNTILRDVLYGFTTLAAPSEATLDRVQVLATSSGIGADTGRITVTNSVIVMAGTGYGITAWANTGDTSDVMVTHSTISGGEGGISVSALAGGTSRVTSDGNAINNASVAAFKFVGNPGTELIYTSGTTTLGSNVAAVVVGGALTPIGQY